MLAERIPPPDLARVVVVGTSGAGKTTLARRLAEILGSEHVELDSLHWGPGWTPRPEFVATVRAAAERPRWVIDGNYAAVRDILWRRSTALVWLDFSLTRVLARALRRTARRIVTRERLYAGNRESVRSALLAKDGIPWWVIRTHGRRRREFPELLERPEYRHLAVIRLESPAAAGTFLAAADSRPQASCSPNA
ncbi:MAG TPA: toxin [Burkholderiales bacterium]|nr:toxin [Burkholderiales bacterium]